ncbi:MAG: polymer-forming cytoskeletal protein [Betaproteobacteria bacterium]|nr:polymer-forming cytoskeletal protein [Betaproteobacteria bacterium]MCC6248248.1 polymer-forming cytoskeletal protein [Rubrivivax sp.]MCL4696052.1 polymer-forming cytoskeletal protein [Burkholderiaceae bacterium]
MLGKKKPPPIRSLIGEGMTVQGTVLFSEGLRIDGRVEGDVIVAGDGHSILVISEKAQVVGKVMAAHVIINGEVQGPIVCHEMLELQPKARVTGDIRYDVLEMHPGAVVDGELRSLKSAEKPQLKLAASNDA